MLPNDRVQSTGRQKLNLVERVQLATDRIPMPQRIVPIIGAVLFLCPVLAPAAVVSKARTKMATAYVAMLAIWIIYVTALYSSDPARSPCLDSRPCPGTPSENARIVSRQLDSVASRAEPGWSWKRRTGERRKPRVSSP